MRQEKQLLSSEIFEKIQQSKGLVLTKYKKMNPNLSSLFRKELAKKGGLFSVVRKRILMKAAEKEGLNLDRDILEGHIGVVFANIDPIETTKTVFQFSAKNEDVLQVLGGRFEGVFYSPEDVVAISKLPSQQQMRAEFLGLLEAPMAQTLSTVEALITSILHCMQNKVDK